MSSRGERPDPNTPSKYERELPSYISDFFVYYLKVHEDGEKLEDWQHDLIDRIAQSIIESIQERMKTSSKSRRAFIGMNAGTVWEDQAGKIMKLTRRNIATFDQEFIQELDDLIMSTLKAEIDPIRTELLDIIQGLYVSEEESSAVREFCCGNSYFVEDLAQHLVEQDAWRLELTERLPIIRFVCQREAFVLKAIQFEEQDHNSSARRVTISAMNESKRFRAAAAKTLEEGNAKVRELIEDYQARLGKAFEIKGVVYQYRLDDQEAVVGNRPTNFQNYRRDFLVFLDADSDTIDPLQSTQTIEEILAASSIVEHEFQDYTTN
eukprot:c33024_g1_i1.p1 GENE.c33024_g1_i1~~c33024_g1_i1.p1  ORF type:complete len:322 (+),score=69.63 c33024_g1_i1:50-1015(+)